MTQSFTFSGFFLFAPFIVGLFVVGMAPWDRKRCGAGRKILIALSIPAIVLAGLIFLKATGTYRMQTAAYMADANVADSIHVQPSVLRSTTTPSAGDASAPLWVNNWAAYVRQETSKGARMIRAQSLTYAPTDEEARASALQQAAMRLEAYVGIRIDPAIGPSVPGADLERFIQQRIVSAPYQIIRDEHLEQTMRPYGELWRCTLLLDASPTNIDRLAADYRAQAHSTAREQFATWGSLAGLTVVIALLYLFLNTVTKGYFAWRLRAAAVMGAIAFVLLVFARMRM